jgi:hypothetical protein
MYFNYFLRGRAFLKIFLYTRLEEYVQNKKSGGQGTTIVQNVTPCCCMLGWQLPVARL